MAKRRASIDSEIYTPLEAYAIGLHEFYRSLRKAGFPVDLALAIITDRSSYPEWLLPSIPDDLENPESWEEEE